MLYGCEIRVTNPRGARSMHSRVLETATDGKTYLYGELSLDDTSGSVERKLFRLCLDSDELIFLEDLPTERQFSRDGDWIRFCALNEFFFRDQETVPLGLFLEEDRKEEVWAAKQMSPEFCDLVQTLASHQVDGDKVLQGLKRRGFSSEFKLIANYLGGWELEVGGERTPVAWLFQEYAKATGL